MANLERYAKATILINSQVLAEAASVTVKRMTNSQMVETIAKGYAGESPGASRTEISVSNAVPRADFEYDPGKDMNGLDIVELTVLAAGKALTTKGTILDDNFSAAVNSSVKLDFNFRGQFAQWESL
jgi:hypothetical protein